MNGNVNMLSDCIAWAMNNFALAMFLLAAIFILLHRIIKSSMHESEIVYRWVALFGLGFSGIYTFVMHVFYPEFTAQVIGWQTSPFQFEVGMSDLAIGILGILSFRASFGFRLATVIGGLLWLWGDAFGHVLQMISHHNYTLGNAGSWFWMDVIIPLILLMCILRMKKEH